MAKRIKPFIDPRRLAPLPKAKTALAHVLKLDAERAFRVAS